MDSSASLAVGETFAGRVVKVQKHCRTLHFTFHFALLICVSGSVGGGPRGQGGQGGHQQVLEGDGR